MDFKKYHSLGMFDKRIDYYSDFRLNSNIVKIMFKKLKVEKIEPKNLTIILNKAIDKNCGLIDYCD